MVSLVIELSCTLAIGLKPTRRFQFEITHSPVAVACVDEAEVFSLWARTLRPAQVTVPPQRRRLRVRAAFFAAAERDLAERRLATRLACFDNAFFDADRRLSRRSARFVARERLVAGFLRRPERPFARSCLAWPFVRDFPRLGGGSFTPARRAFDKPMAIACSGERAPCSPSRICSISSRTNSPA